jgi:PII-like signaling protein
MNEDCLKLTSFFGERHRVGGRFVADVLCDLYGLHDIAASIMLRGTEGFGLKHHPAHRPFPLALRGPSAGVDRGGQA